MGISDLNLMLTVLNGEQYTTTIFKQRQRTERGFQTWANTLCASMLHSFLTRLFSKQKLKQSLHTVAHCDMCHSYNVHHIRTLGISFNKRMLMPISALNSNYRTMFKCILQTLVDRAWLSRAYHPSCQIKTLIHLPYGCTHKLSTLHRHAFPLPVYINIKVPKRAHMIVRNPEITISDPIE